MLAYVRKQSILGINGLQRTILGLCTRTQTDGKIYFNVLVINLSHVMESSVHVIKTRMAGLRNEFDILLEYLGNTV